MIILLLTLWKTNLKLIQCTQIFQKLLMRKITHCRFKNQKQWVWMEKCYFGSRAYVTGCSQSIKIGTFIHGSHCGPLIFKLFINDIDKDFINSQFLVFADDVKIFDRINAFVAIHLQPSLDFAIGLGLMIDIKC